MIVLSPHTTEALSPHTKGQSWVMFVQAKPPCGGIGGPIWIEGVGSDDEVSDRLREIDRWCPYETFIIGLQPTDTPEELAAAIQAQHQTSRLRHDWFEPTPELILLIQHNGQQAVIALLERVQPGGVPDGVVDIKTIAEFLDVSVPTVRRLVKAGVIPAIRMGKALRFVTADVLESLGQREG